jgi:hypothetical protein
VASGPLTGDLKIIMLHLPAKLLVLLILKFCSMICHYDARPIPIYRNYWQEGLLICPSDFDDFSIKLNCKLTDREQLVAHKKLFYDHFQKMFSGDAFGKSLINVMQDFSSSRS